MMSRKNIRDYLGFLPIYGCISTGIIYLGIGVIAILSFLKLKEGGADESSMLMFLNDYVIGKIFIWIILLGTVSYITWRIYEAIVDPYDYGNNAKGKAKRVGIALSSIVDALIAYAAIRILLGSSNVQADGRPDEERQIVSHLLQEDWGNWFIIIIGFIVFITAVLQFLYGITRGYKERLNVAQFSSVKKITIHVFAWTGYLARGVILGITGFFLIKAGLLKDAQYVVNTDKAFDFIGDHVGHVYFILVALGTICYGLFMFLLGATYKAGKD